MAADLRGATTGRFGGKPSSFMREVMKEYAVVIERGPDNMSAYAPDLPGCITTGRTVEEIELNIREAIELHLKGMAEEGADRRPLDVRSRSSSGCRPALLARPFR